MNKKSYVSGASTQPLFGDTIGENLRKIVERFPAREALVVDEQNVRMDYQTFWQHTTRLGKALLKAGIEKGDRVGIWSANRYEWVITQFATARVGAILVNINPGYRSSGLEYALNQSGIKLLISALCFRTTDYAEILDSISSRLIHLEQIVFLDKDWDTFLQEGESISNAELEERENSLSFDDAINIQYTSGTTGLPKGATLTHHNILNNGFFIGERMYYTEKDRVCIPVPFYHCFGMVLGNMAVVTHGGCMVIPGEVFEPEMVLSVVEKEKCTSLYGVPTMFIAELALPNFEKFNLTSLRTGIMAGALCPMDTMQQVIQKMNMKEITICYGMTETSPVSTQTYADDPIDKRVSTVGRVHPHLEVKIVDPSTGDIVPVGKRGELCTRGYSVMLGYWNDEKATKKVIDKNRWMHSGDVAMMDHDGFISIVGRIKDIIIRGGENISPKEIEDFLLVHPAVLDIQVIGVPSHKYGEEVMAWVRVKPNMSCTEEDLLSFCKGKIATFKIPKYWKFVDDFPMTVTGKIRKVEMREISAKELGLDHLRSIHTED